ncbi:MAG: PQQ-dependent sugar dehydrogenase, partial [Asticcacaulis sp.]|nr:PQQ-dependent sugar dehydrogenase [Asticcacaulis sp.]
MPGTRMPVAVDDTKDRQNLIAYLMSLTGATQAAKTQTSATTYDWRDDAPGVRHKVTEADLPPPFATSSAGNFPMVLDARDAAPQVPAGFTVERFATGLDNPRQLRLAPNGDLYVVEPGPGKVLVFRNHNGQLSPKPEEVMSGLSRPFGIAFYPAENPKYIYIAGSVVRFDYARPGKPETIVADLSSTGGHNTRDIVVSPDGGYIYVSVGSASNLADDIGRAPDGFVASHALGEAWGSEAGRAMVLRFTPDGKDRTVVATGLRNCVGLGVHPDTGDLYCTVNERDGTGDNLVPDYFTRVKPGQFFGWPWYYLGDHEDPRRAGERPDLTGKATAPDLWFVSHSAPLGFTFYRAPAGAAKPFPADFTGNAFVALHGSWNRNNRTGSKVVRVHFEGGKPAGEYADFMTGFVRGDHSVSGRPVAVAVGPDGALYVSDDGGNCIWRIAPYNLLNPYTGLQSRRC